MRAAAVAVGLVLLLAATVARADDDPRAQVEAAERGPADPDALFAAGRACEDKLLDPARALALYERILRETPDARVASAADRRAEHLRGELGTGGEHAAQAAALAKLVAEADRSDPVRVIADGDALIAAAWPGAPEAALWLAEWLRRHARYADADARYQLVITRWPDAPQARLARRGAAGCALDARDWDRAEALARALPAADPADRGTRDELIAAAARGRWRDRIYTGAWLGLALALAALLASLGEAIARRGPADDRSIASGAGGARARRGRRWPAARPPIEVMFLAPIAALLVAVSFTAHRAIAPAVLRISLVGLALAWLSGSTLDLLRARGRAVRARSLGHVVACAVGVVAIGYIAITRDGLLDLLVETVKFGPE